jgi:manganese-dependent inorganic pyrophosphatase
VTGIRAERIVYVVGHTHPDADSVCSAIAYAELKRTLGRRDVRAARAGELDAATSFLLQRFAVPTPTLLTDAAGLDLILVDHNETGLALPNIARANVLEVWEHHRLGDLHPPKPIFFHCEPVGATATLIAEQYSLHGATPPPPVAGILLGAILVDTAGYRSPTTGEKDRQAGRWLARIAGVDADALGEELLRLRAASVERRTAAELVRGDYKELRLGRARVGIAQVEVIRPGTLARREEEIRRAMRALREESSLTQVILMITDVEARASDLWFVGERRDVFERAFGRLDRDAVHLDGCMSRKKQVVPPLQRAFEEGDRGPDAGARERPLEAAPQST